MWFILIANGSNSNGAWQTDFVFAYQKKWFTKIRVSKNVHLRFSIYSLKTPELRFKMASVFRMTVKNWFFDYKSVKTDFFYVISLRSSNEWSYITYFIEEKFFVRTKVMKDFFILKQDGTTCLKVSENWFFCYNFGNI
jgi:hypothetical protein